METQINVKEWLNARGITDHAIEKFNIAWDNQKISIPIFNEQHEFLFNKFRRLPDKLDGPKYWYEAGMTTQLYPAWIEITKQIIVCEGEFDSIVLNINGLPAVTSTGGAGAFHPEWVEEIEDVYVCYDNDPAGRKNAFTLASVLGATLIILEDVKDVTDYYLKHGAEKFNELMQKKMENGYKFAKPPSLENKKLTKAFLKDLKFGCGERLATIQRIKNDGYPVEEYFEINKKLYSEIEAMEKAEDLKRKSGKQFNGTFMQKIKKAKEFPLTSLYTERGRSSPKRIMGKCPFPDHKDSTPSFMVYKDQNSWWCYGCGMGGDVIDFLMKRDGVSLKEAVNKLTNNYEAS